VGVKVDTNLTTDAWNHTLQESKRAATRRTSGKMKQKKDAFEIREKRENYTFTLLNAYNVAINLDIWMSGGRPTQGTSPAGVLPPPPEGSPTKESPAPPTLEGAAQEESGTTPCVGRNQTRIYLSLTDGPLFLTTTLAPPQYGAQEHSLIPAGSEAPTAPPIDMPRKTREVPAMQYLHPVIRIEKGLVNISYNGPTQTASGKRDGEETSHYQKGYRDAEREEHQRSEETYYKDESGRGNQGYRARGRDRAPRKYPKWCFHCKQPGHWIKDCPSYHPK